MTGTERSETILKDSMESIPKPEMLLGFMIALDAPEEPCTEKTDPDSQSSPAEGPSADTPNLVDVTIYPVPTRDNIQVRIDKGISKKPLELMLFDADGKLLKTGIIGGKEGSTTVMDLSDLASGIYFLKGLGQQYLFEEKVLKL